MKRRLPVVFPELAPITDEVRRVCMKDQSNPVLYCTYTLQLEKNYSQSYEPHHIKSLGSIDDFVRALERFCNGNVSFLICLEFDAIYILA